MMVIREGWQDLMINEVVQMRISAMAKMMLHQGVHVLVQCEKIGTSGSHLQ